MQDGEVAIDPQLTAFREAMKMVHENRGRISRISLLFDHIGLFSEQFIDGTLGLSNHQRNKRINLGYLLPEIRDQYRELATEVGVDINQVRVMTEAQCRMVMLQKYEDLSRSVRGRMMYAEGAGSCGDEVCDVPTDTEAEQIRVSCKGIAAEAYRRLARHGDVVAFWSYDKKRCRYDVLADAINLARDEMGVERKIESRIVSADGKKMIVTDGSSLECVAL